MMRKAKKQSGFTMIELIIVMVITALVLGGIISYAGNVYRQYRMTADQTSMKADAANIRVLMQSAADEGGKAVLHNDNKGVTFTGKKGTDIFFLRDGAVYLRHNNTSERKLTGFEVSEAVWTQDKGVLSMDVTFSYNNIQTKKTDYQKVIKDVYLSK
ncbi:MAG: type II secretion system GspH family protein [Firmicutes bacterium]|nr:type II secretion system GspH family protein [Bacillota bacterium]